MIRQLNNSIKELAEAPKGRKAAGVSSSAGFLLERNLEMSKLIPLTQGKFAIIDNENYKKLSKYNWYVAKSGKQWYAERTFNFGNRKFGIISMHRQLLNLKHGDGKHTDHINHNALDNQMVNLRICTQSQNQHNQAIRKNKTSQYKGVHWSKKKYQAEIKFNQKTIYLGRFTDEKEAALAYDEAARRYFGEFACTNF